jgi:hypothetical protein
MAPLPGSHDQKGSAAFLICRFEEPAAWGSALEFKECKECKNCIMQKVHLY